jgi:hypothetical protein
MSFALALCGIILLAAQPFQKNYTYVILYPTGQKFYYQRISPFSDFSNLIQFTPSMKMLISLDISKSYQLLGTGLDDMVGLFDLYFDKPAGRKNFTVVDDRDVLLTDVFRGTYDYVLMTIGDWNSISKQSNNYGQITMFYNVKSNDSGEIYFLQKKINITCCNTRMDEKITFR